MGLEFVSTSGWSEGGPDVTLTRPRTVKRIQGDGNCLFRCISYLVTGSEEQHGRVREVILDHLRYLMLHDCLNNTYSSIEEYLQVSSMDLDGTWGMEVEIMTIAHLLNTSILCTTQKWLIGGDLVLTWLMKHYTLTLRLCQCLLEMLVIILRLYVQHSALAKSWCHYYVRVLCGLWCLIEPRITDMSMFIRNRVDHFEVVCTIVP